jgi:hypothetical protein
MPDRDEPRDPQILRVIWKTPLIHVRIATEGGLCRTPDGYVPYRAGDILIGKSGDPHTTIPRDEFLATHTLFYQSDSPTIASYRRNTPVLLARRLDAALIALLELAGPRDARPGEWLIRHPENRLAVVPDALFRELYEPAPGEPGWPNSHGLPA